ncbi:hypothetical protein [Paraliobacillus sediminis]|uniref:hypothetical protein n=1 Tax=Paraliobacillus sediminis TaxID=1885916 RepID=UPI000E3E21B1|nr:hypothetical protein [Paraliobacillus sediminis]
MTLRKWLIYTFIILCLFSIFMDLKVGSPIDYTTDELALTNDKTRKVIVNKEQLKFEVVSYQITAGDTFISIMDQINEQSLDWNLEQYINDFKALNPKVNVHELKENGSYLFPHYIY